MDPLNISRFGIRKSRFDRYCYAIRRTNAWTSLFWSTLQNKQTNLLPFKDFTCNILHWAMSAEWSRPVCSDIRIPLQALNLKVYLDFHFFLPSSHILMWYLTIWHTISIFLTSSYVLAQKSYLVVFTSCIVGFVERFKPSNILAKTLKACKKIKMIKTKVISNK